MTLPCIDCITLVMCRSSYFRDIEKSDGNTNLGYINLRNKCPMLDQFFKILVHDDNYEEYVKAYRALTTFIEGNSR